jgi:hypothetical protein
MSRRSCEFVPRREPCHLLAVVTAGTDMNRREEWRKVLDREVQRWSTMTFEQLLSELRELQVYELECDAKTYQVEVQMLTQTNESLQVMVAVDDGSMPASLVPATHIFIRNRP